jgi:predicted MPP superfamily phosphohydrolase
MAGLACIALITIAYGLAEARSMPLTRRALIEFPQLPGNTKPIKMALLSDIHIGNPATSPARLENIVAAVNAENPDVVVIVGDFVNGDYPEDSAAKPGLLKGPLATLEAPLGVFATLGNHDHWTDQKAVRDVLQRDGITVLVNSAGRAGPFAIAGIDDATSGHADSERVMHAAKRLGGIPIVITHSPAIVSWLPPTVPLMLAGHTHCGQVVLGAGTWKVYPTEWLFTRPYPKAVRCGMGRVGKTLTIVTGGVGTTSAPLRYGAPPDWWLLTLAPVQGDPVKSALRNGSAGGR